MNLFDKYKLGYSYKEFLDKYGSDAHKARWQQMHAQVKLTEAQTTLLKAFKRQMPALCLAGAWCGDCVNQCTIFEHFAAVAPAIQIRYLDRDEHADVQQMLQINGGNRVPVVVFFSEDGAEVARYGERTLSKYRMMMKEQTEGCPTGIGHDPLLSQVTQEWLNEFERVQWILRLSPRLRKIHGD